MSSSLWLKLHVNLINHPKTTRLARRLECSQVQAIGHLVCLWTFALDYAEDGNITKFQDEEIALAAKWEGEDSSRFVADLEATRWIERTRTGELRIHDWEQYGGRLFEQRSQTNERVKRHRERKESGEKTTSRTRDTGDAKAAAPTRAPKKEAPPQRITEKALEESFERFWTAYPLKSGKQGALEVWADIAPSGELERDIHAGLMRAKRSPQWTKDGGEFIPHPAKWLVGRRWEDEPTPERVMKLEL